MLNLYRAGALEWTWFASGLACLAAGARLASGRRLAFPPPAAAWALWGAAFPLACVLFKLAQYAAHESMLDSAVMINLAWNAAHGHGLTSSLLGGVSYWSVHFAFLYALLSPVLFAWPSPVPFFVLHGLALGSIPLCVFLLAGGDDRRDDLAWPAALLAAGHPLFCGVLGAVLDNSSYAAPLFLWAVWCWGARRRAAAVVLALLTLSTRETLPFLFGGLGAYAWTLARSARERAAAAAFAAAAAAVWLAELSALRAAQARAGVLVDYWALYPALGGARHDVLRNVLGRPWLVAAALVWPPVKSWHFVRTMLSFGFLPLAAGAAALPMLAVWLPQQLGDPATNFHNLIGHQGSYVLGPALWAAVLGLRRADAALGETGRRRLAGGVLAVAACGFFAARFHLPAGALPSSWDEEGPRAVAAIAPGDKVWSDVYFASHLAARSEIKALPLGDDPSFTRGRFEPDSVLLSRHWLARAAPEVTADVLKTVRERGLVPVFTGPDLIVLSRPRKD